MYHDDNVAVLVAIRVAQMVFGGLCVLLRVL